MLLNQSIYAYASMDTHAAIHKETVPKESAPSHTPFLVSYYAGDCVVRLDAITDKAALAAWSLYCVVDPRSHVDNREAANCPALTLR
jgi:hypothetical protein